MSTEIEKMKERRRPTRPSDTEERLSSVMMSPARLVAALALLRTQDLHLASPEAGVWGDVVPPTESELHAAREAVVKVGKQALDALRWP